ncbi:UPF0488 protein C8orf33 homolog [Silurus meridionalis]|uniref:UPF0488 protein C8orf33 homolog n=1 Tax=Silurus meridionalis TaxID=175797 RepID=UPI001EEC9730|nr:UPF0488 protein C8orf33 homolog [Silurus meridionalis]XP_046702605.1 UPF0488 protein C8orf33 homolog [Silurus meridionalis]
MDPSETRPGHESETGSGFAFNFQTPAAAAQTEAEPDPSAGGTETGEAARDSKPTAKKKKKKKKKSGVSGGEEAGLENVSKPGEEVAEQESTKLTPEQQLSRELDWCIEQLELGLRTQKSSTKQREEASRALKTLRSSKAPVVKKRQVMRAVSGDYRKKMEEDRERQQKLIRSAMSLATVTRVSEPRCRAAYTRHVPTRQPAAHADVSPPPLPAEQTGGDRFVLRPSGQEFRFNFDV